MVKENFIGNLELLISREGRGAKARLARHLGVSAPAITHLLTGKNSPSLDRVEEIAEFFGVSGVSLLTSPAKNRAGSKRHPLRN